MFYLFLIKQISLNAHTIMSKKYTIRIASSIINRWKQHSILLCISCLVFNMLYDTF